MKNFFTLLVLLCFSFSGFSQTIYMEANFDDGLPTDWTIDDDWTIGTAAAVSSQFFPVPETTTGNVACFNDDNLGNGHVGGGAITTAAIDLTAGEGTIFLTMDSYFPNVDYGGLDETAIISISTDMGATFSTLVDLTGGDSEFSLLFFDVTSYIGETIMLQFAYDDGEAWNYGWAFDNVKVSNEVLPIPAFDYAIHAGGSVVIDQALEGVEYHNSGYIFNNGLETITSYDLEMTNGTDVITSSVTGVEIPYNTFAYYTIEEGVTVSGNQTWTVSITNVNGSADADDNVADNEMSFNLNAVSNVHPDKAVVVEEATGTWCQFCPRGTVYLDEMSKRFGDHFVGIAVHNGDPMALAAYDSAIGNFPGFAGYPSVIYQRESIIDPDAIVAPSLADMQVAPPAAITVGAVMDGSSMTTSVEINFLEDASDEYSVAVVLSQDGLSGTTNGWGQVNAYSGGGIGEMGGFELLPGVVQGFTYDHVGVALIGGYAGVSGEVDGDYVAGDVDGFVFDAYDIAALVMDDVHVVGLLINSDGEIVNAKAVSIAEALDNGIFVSSTNDVYDNNLATVFPNPVTATANIQISLDDAADVTVSLVNALGQTVGVTQYGKLAGDNQLEFDMNSYAEGIYLMHVQAGNRFFSKKLSKVK